jgi:hypothetical protein
VEDLYIPEVEGMNIVEKHDHPMNHMLGEEGMNMAKEHYHLTNHRLEVEDMDMMEVGVWIWWRSACRITDWRWRVLIGRIVI